MYPPVIADSVLHLVVLGAGTEVCRCDTDTHTDTLTHARARAHARTHARTHAHTHTHTHTRTHNLNTAS